MMHLYLMHLRLFMALSSMYSPSNADLSTIWAIEPSDGGYDYQVFVRKAEGWEFYCIRIDWSPAVGTYYQVTHRSGLL